MNRVRGLLRLDVLSWLFGCRGLVGTSTGIGFDGQRSG
jgi:hypothetical protein